MVTKDTLSVALVLVPTLMYVLILMPILILMLMLMPILNLRIAALADPSRRNIPTPTRLSQRAATI